MRNSVVCIYEWSENYLAYEYKTGASVAWDRNELPELVVDISPKADIPCFFDAWQRKDALTGEQISGFVVRLRRSAGEWDFGMRLARKYGWELLEE